MEYAVVFAAAYLALATSWFASKTLGYSHTRLTISELGAVDMPHQHWVAWAVFFPVSVACLLIASWLASHDAAWSAVGLAVCLGVGYGWSAVFPCDQGSPLKGSVRNQLHMLAGGVQYLGGAAALWIFGRGAEAVEQLFFLAAAFVGLATLAMFLPWLNLYRGVIQRIAEIILFTALTFMVADVDPAG